MMQRNVKSVLSQPKLVYESRLIDINEENLESIKENFDEFDIDYPKEKVEEKLEGKKYAEALNTLKETALMGAERRGIELYELEDLIDWKESKIPIKVVSVENPGEAYSEGKKDVIPDSDYDVSLGIKSIRSINRDIEEDKTLKEVLENIPKLYE